jgi:hypothetical protein
MPVDLRFVTIGAFFRFDLTVRCPMFVRSWLWCRSEDGIQPAPTFDFLTPEYTLGEVLSS